VIFQITLLVHFVSLSTVYAQDTVETRASSVEDPRFASGFVTRVELNAISTSDEGLVGALEQTPGLSIQRQSSFGQPAYVQIRGGNPRQLVVLMNGIRIRVPSGLGFNVGSLATTGMDHVSVYRGPAAMIHGAGALTGAIELNIAPQQPPETTTLSASLLSGSFGSHEVAGSADFALKKRGSARVAANARSSKGDFTFIDPQGVDQQRLNNDHTHVQAVGGVNWRGPKGRLGMSLLMERGESGVAGPSEFQNLFDQARISEQRIVATSSGTRRDVLKGERWTVDLNRVFGLQWRGLRYENESAVLGQGELLNTSSATGTQAGVSLLLSTRSLYFATLSAGVRTEFFFSTQRNQSDERATLNARRKTMHVALGQEKIALNQRLHLTAAARLEVVHEQTQNWVPWMGAFGVIFQPLPKFAEFNLIANTSKTYRIPDFDELYLNTEFVQGDPDLAPERGWMNDVGARLDLEQAPFWLPTSVEAVLFANLIQDQISFVPVSAYLVKARNFERVRSQGTELSMVFAPVKAVSLRANHTWTQSFRPSSSPVRLQLPSIPEHRIDARLGVQLAKLLSLKRLDALELSSRAAWRSDVYLDTFGAQKNPAWLRLDAGLLVQPRRWLSLQFDVTNILNHQRAMDSLQRPLPGRAFFLSLTAKRQVKQ